MQAPANISTAALRTPRFAAARKRLAFVAATCSGPQFSFANGGLTGATAKRHWLIVYASVLPGLPLVLRQRDEIDPQLQQPHRVLPAADLAHKHMRAVPRTTPISLSSFARSSASHAFRSPSRSTTIEAPSTENSTGGSSTDYAWNPTAWQNGRSRITHSNTQPFGTPFGIRASMMIGRDRSRGSNCWQAAT